MLDGFQIVGQWWPANEPDVVVQGTLIYNHQDGIMLTATIPENNIVKFNRFKPYIILGKSNSRLITLENCTFFRARQLIGDNREFDLHAEKAFTGAHFQKTEEIKFTSIDANYSYLDEWMDTHGFSHSYLDDMNEKIEYRKPDEIQVEIDNGTIIRILPIVNSTEWGRTWKKAIIEQKWIVRIEKKQEATLNEYLEIIKHLQTFLCLAIKEPIHVLSLEGETNQEPNIEYSQTVGIYYRSFYLSKPSEYLPRYMLFTYPDIKENVKNMLKVWFEKINVLKPICGRYFEILVNPYLYPENYFLNLVQAVEGFHFRVIFSKDDYQCLSLRLEDLLNISGDIVPQLFAGRITFLNVTVNTRNYLSHLNIKREKEAAKSDELLILSRKLKIILEVMLLLETGMDQSKLKWFFSKNKDIPMDAIGTLHGRSSTKKK